MTPGHLKGCSTTGHGPWSLRRCLLADMKALAKAAEEVPLQDRLKAMCVILGVGPRTAAELPKGAMAAAQAAIQTGQAFEESVYADGMQVYV